MNYKNIVMDGYPDSISKEAFERAEGFIGIKLPYQLFELVKDHNRGAPKNADLKVTMPMGEATVNALGGFLSFNEIDSENILECYFDRPDHFPQDERFVLFGMTGNEDYFLFFYEKGKDDPQPKVYYWAHEYSDINGGLVFLANSFEEFLNMLKPEGYYD